MFLLWDLWTEDLVLRWILCGAMCGRVCEGTGWGVVGPGPVWKEFRWTRGGLCQLFVVGWGGGRGGHVESRGRRRAGRRRRRGLLCGGRLMSLKDS